MNAVLRQRMASSPQWLRDITEAYSRMPEFVREDLLEGLLVGGGIALPVAMMPNQDAEERAAAILGGIGAATLGGAASRRLGASIGRRVHADELPAGSYGYNLGRAAGRKDVLVDTMTDLLGAAPPPRITGEEFGRAIGRAVGDEVFGIGGTLAALAAAQAMDRTPDAQPQPTLSEVAGGTIPGAVLGLLTSGLASGMVDTVGLNRALTDVDPSGSRPDWSQYTVFGRQNKRGQ